MSREFRQIHWDEQLADDCRQLTRLAIREDLDRGCDWTTLAMVPADARGAALMVAREAGVVAGLQIAQTALAELDTSLQWNALCRDGEAIGPNAVLARMEGPARDLLTAERVVLNFTGRLSGIATLTQRYVAAVEGTGARVYDTRKTTPGWRRLEKYAVRCGGGSNHRTGLFDAILIKDNHLAFASESCRATPADAVRQARQFLRNAAADAPELADLIVEIEVDTLEQLEGVLPAQPDIVLLDNMRPEQLHRAVALRDRLAPATELEASGGITLETIRSVAESGVERISVGALTLAAVSLDVGLDWLGTGR